MIFGSGLIIHSMVYKMGIYFKPVLAINFKTYDSAFGQKALLIGKSAEKVKKELNDIEIILIPPFTEIRTIIENIELPVYAQHADPYDYGAYTGWIPIRALKDLGVHGVLLNHSEHRLRLDEIVQTVMKAKTLGLRTLVCADTPEAAAAVAAIKPDYVAVEPPELIGTGVAVSKAKPEVVTNTVRKVREVNQEVIILTGAGITTGEDAAKAIELGTQGVLVASAIMKAPDPYKVIKDMAQAMLEAAKKIVLE